MKICPFKCILTVCISLFCVSICKITDQGYAVAKSYRFPGWCSCAVVFVALNQIRVAAVFERANALVSLLGKVDFVKLDGCITNSCTSQTNLGQGSWTAPWLVHGVSSDPRLSEPPVFLQPGEEF